MGVGTLIIFISMVIIAAMAAGIMLYSGNLLRNDAREMLDDTTDALTEGLEVVSVIGDRNENGNDSTIIRARFPKRDPYKPLPGTLESVKVTPDGTSPLKMELTWTSGVDLETGLKEEQIYRIASLTLNGTLDPVSTLDKVTSSCTLIATIPYDKNDDDEKTYIDYTIGDLHSLYYAYAVVGMDKSSNRVLYDSVEFFNITDNTTRDEDLTPPPVGTHYSLEQSLQGNIKLLWFPSIVNTGTPLIKQYIYSNGSSLENAGTYTDSDGKMKVRIHEDNTLVAVLNGSVSEYFYYPSKSGLYNYAIIGEDAAGNQAMYRVFEGINVSWVDQSPPAGVTDLFYFKKPNSIRLEWKTAMDEDTGIGGYNIYRVEDPTVVNTLAKVKNRAPMATLTGDATKYEDFKGFSNIYYYYLVTAIDEAGNFASPVIPTDSFQVLDFKVRPRMGSKPVNLEEISIDIYDGTDHITLHYDEESANDTFTAEAVMDPGGNFARHSVLDKGSMVNIEINLADIGLALTSDKEVVVKIMHAESTVGIHTFEVPPMLDERFVMIW